MPPHSARPNTKIITLDYHETSQAKEESAGGRGPSPASAASKAGLKSIRMLTATKRVGPRRPPLVRQDTFVVEEGDELAARNQNGNNIEAILDGSNSSDDVKRYLANHFKMIREENERLRTGLREKSAQLDQIATEHLGCKSVKKELRKVAADLESAEKQLERERIKVRVMAKKMKEGETQQEEVTWIGLPNVNNKDSSINSGSDESNESLRSKLKAANVQLLSMRNEIDHLKKTASQKSDDVLRAPTRGGSSNSRLNDSGESLVQLKKRCQVSEAEREKLTEYTKVLNQRLGDFQEKTSKAEFQFRDERRKTAKLQRMLEQAHVVIRDIDSGGNSSKSASSPRDPALGSAAGRKFKDKDDEIAALSEELEVSRKELEKTKTKREEDLEMYLKMAEDSRKAFAENGAV